MTKTFAATLGIPGITVAQAVEILDGLTFTGTRPAIGRAFLLSERWNADGTRRLTFKQIARWYCLHITTVQNQHAAILRRLREHLEGQPPTPAGMDRVVR